MPSTHKFQLLLALSAVLLIPGYASGSKPLIELAKDGLIYSSDAE